MSDATWRRTGNRFGGGHMLGERKTSSTSRTVAMRSLGSVVYAARLSDGTIKIGWTQHFEDRMRYLSHHTGQDVELIAFRLGDLEDEQAIHAGLVEYRIEGHREFYRPAPEVLAVVNEMRSALNMPPVAA